MKNLSWGVGVKLTPAITRTAELLDPYFEGEPSWITSGLRTPIDQLQVILKKMLQHNLEDEFPEVKTSLGAGIEYKIYIPEFNQELYWWARIWSKLLSLGDIVNPPIPTEVLFDYFRPGSLTNKKGEIISISPHMRGLALDIGGGKSLIEKAKRVMKAKQEGSCFILNFLVEHINNAVHVDVQQIG